MNFILEKLKVPKIYIPLIILLGLSLLFSIFHWAMIPTITKLGGVEITTYNNSNLAIKLRGQEIPTWSKTKAGLIVQELFINSEGLSYRQDGIVSIEYFKVKELNEKIINTKWLSSPSLEDRSLFIKTVRYEQNINQAFKNLTQIQRVDYHPNGEVKKALSFSISEESPGEIEYYQNGQVKKENWTRVSFLKKDGILEKTYFPTGVLKQEKFCPASDKKCKNKNLVVIRNYHETGFAKKEEILIPYKEAFYEKNEIREFYEDGSLKLSKNPLTKKNVSYYQSGQIWAEDFINHPEGMNFIEYYESGSLKSQSFLNGGEINPSLKVEHFFESGQAEKEEWLTLVEGKLVPHRLGAPSLIEYEENGNKTKERWFWNGKAHNSFGPATVIYSSPFCTREWAEFGEVVKSETDIAINCSRHFIKASLTNK